MVLHLSVPAEPMSAHSWFPGELGLGMLASCVALVSLHSAIWLVEKRTSSAATVGLVQASQGAVHVTTAVVFPVVTLMLTVRLGDVLRRCAPGEQARCQGENEGSHGRIPFCDRRTDPLCGRGATRLRLAGARPPKGRTDALPGGQVIFV